MVNFRGYFINVDGMVRRKRHMQDQLRSVELHDVFERWPAVDAGNVQNLTNTSYAPGHWSSTKWELTKFEVAVFESHLGIWQRAAMTREGPVVVLEDDVVLSSRFREFIVSLAATDNRFDVVKLDGINKVRRFGAQLDVCSPTQPDFSIRPIVQTISSAAGYVVSNEGATKLVEWSSTYSDGVDDFLFRPRQGYQLYQAFPAVCAQGVALLPEQELVKSQPLFVRGENSLVYGGGRQNRGPLTFQVVREVKRGVRRLRRAFFSDRQIVKGNGFIGVVPLAHDLERRV